MCDPENTKHFAIFDRCGHQLPTQACDYYSYAHHKCYAAPDLAKDVNCYRWDDGKVFHELCRFCSEKKDIEGAWKYGVGWADREKFR